jgi:hypothetical protein
VGNAPVQIMLNNGSPLSPRGAMGKWNDPDYPASGTEFVKRPKSRL